jgi:hypothetical protein
MVWRLELPHNKAWLLMALSDHAHDDGTRCFPGVGKLAWKTGYGARQVRRILHDLRDDGIIEPVAFVQGGRGRATEYTLYLARGTMKPLYEVDRGDHIKDDILTLALSGKPDIPGQKDDIPGKNPDTTGQKHDTAIAAQPSVTIIEPSGEPSVHNKGSWRRTLRAIHGWDKKGEPHMDTLEMWIEEKGWLKDQLEASAIGLAATSEKTLKGYRDMAAAFQRRLNQGYDDPGRYADNGRGAGRLPAAAGGPDSGQGGGWDNRGG